MNDSALDSKWQVFVQCGGFKLLAVAGLSGHSMSIVCYLINCYFSRITELLTSSRELSVLLGMTVSEVEICLKSLCEMNILRQDRNNGERMLLSLNLNPQTWKNLLLPENRDNGMRRRIGDAANVLRMHPQSGHPNQLHNQLNQQNLNAESNSHSSSTSNSNTNLNAIQALNFPLQVVRFEKETSEGGSKQNEESSTASKSSNSSADHQNADTKHQDEEGGFLSDTEILKSFLNSHPECDFERESFFLETLIGTHAREQVARMIETFGNELRSLGMLVGAWVHYSQKLEQVSAYDQATSLDEYRRTAEAHDEVLRRAARKFLHHASAEDLFLGADERVLLNVFEEHDHPRRQLYWALKMRSRYENLKSFFTEWAHLAENPAPQWSKKPQRSID